MGAAPVAAARVETVPASLSLTGEQRQSLCARLGGRDGLTRGMLAQLIERGYTLPRIFEIVGEAARRGRPLSMFLWERGHLTGRDLDEVIFSNVTCEFAVLPPYRVWELVELRDGVVFRRILRPGDCTPEELHVAQK